MNEQAMPTPVPIFSLRNEEGCSLDISAWGTLFQVKVWVSKKSGEQDQWTHVPPIVLHEIRADILKALKSDNGFTVSKMANTKWDAASTSFLPTLQWTVKKDIQPEYAYSLTIEFPASNKSFTFPFKRDRNIITTSNTQEDTAEMSAEMARRCIEAFSPMNSALSVGISKFGTTPPSKTKTNPQTAAIMASNSGPDDDIPF